MTILIDDASEPGAWQRELEQRPRRCEWCKNFRVSYEGRQEVVLGQVATTYAWTPSCALNRPLVPCEQYEREPDSDEERGEHE